MKTIFTLTHKFQFQNKHIKLLEFENLPDIIYDFQIISNKFKKAFFPFG